VKGLSSGSSGGIRGVGKIAVLVLAAILIVPAAALLPRASASPSSIVSGATVLQEAIASLESGQGPASGTSWTCQSSGSLSAQCGSSASGGGSLDPAGIGKGQWIDIPHGRAAGGIAYDPYEGRVILFGGENASGPLGDTWAYRNGSWSQVLTSPEPSPREWPAMAYDPVDNYVVLFGGYDNGTYLNDTWTFQSGSWTELTPSVSPAARAGASFAYDARDGYMLLFGGRNATHYFNDTWEFLGGTWTRLPTKGSVPPLAWSGMVYDTATYSVVLFGGQNASGYSNQTWRYEAGTWKLLAFKTNPLGRSQAAMAYDPVIREIVLFGGTDGSLLSDTWTFNGTWNLVSGPGPSARVGAYVTFDGAASDNYVVLMGGNNSTRDYRVSTWSFSGSWSEVTSGVWPPASAAASMVWDPTLGGALLFGGFTVINGSLTFLNQTWMFIGGSWFRVNTSVAPSARSFASMTFVGGANNSTSGFVLLFGGSNRLQEFNDTWKFANNTWTPVSTIRAPPARAGADLVYDEYAGAAVLFGGGTGNGSIVFNDTWWFNTTSSNWELLNTSVAPSPRWGAAATYDAVNDSVLLFGGVTSSGSTLNDTWILHGANPARLKWTQVPTSVAPPARGFATLVWDNVARYAVLFGGSPSYNVFLGDMWIFYQGNWTRITPAPIPSARASAVSVFDPSNFAVILFGGESQKFLNDTWEWTLFIVRAYAQRPVVDVGVPDTFNATVFGGIPPYSFFWTFGDGASSHLKIPSHVYTQPSPPGGYNVTLTVNDSSTNSSTVSLPVVVNPALVVDARATPNPVDVGQVVTFNATSTGGTPPVQFTWDFGDGHKGTAPNTTHVYASSGTYAATLWANDSGGMNISRTINITVESSPVASIVATPSVSDVNLPISFTSKVSGGNPPYTYSWLLGDGVSNHSSSLDYAYPSPGTYMVQLWVNDTFGESAFAKTTVTVNPALSATISPSAPVTTDVGIPLNFYGNASGGTAPYTVTWRFGDGGQGLGAHITHAFTVAGTYTVSLWVNDSAGASVHKTVSVTVDPAPTAQVSFAPNPTDVGLAVSFTATVSGGIPPYSVSWNLGDGTRGTGSSVTHSYAAPGLYPIKVWVNDSIGGSYVTNGTVLVNPPPTVTVQATPAITDVGHAVQFTAAESGGTSPVQISWAFGDGSRGTGASVSHSYASPGNYTVRVWANDSVGMSASQSVSITVNPALSITYFRASSSNITTGSTLFLNVTAAGGTGPWTNTYAGLPPPCVSANTASLSCTPTQTGTYNITVTVTDALGASASSTVTLHVLSPPSKSPAGFLGLSGNEGYYLLLGIVALLVILVGVGLYTRRRATKGGASREAPPSPAEASQNSTQEKS